MNMLFPPIVWAPVGDTPLVTVWQPTSPVLKARHGEVAAAVRADFKERLAERLVDGATRCGLSVLTSKSVSPHIDQDFHPWSVLWILCAGVDHRLWVADHVPSNPRSEVTRRPMKRPQVSVPLQPGTLVRFHGHRTHWMDPASDKGLLQAVSDDFAEPPTLEEAQAVFENALQDFRPAA